MRALLVLAAFLWLTGAARAEGVQEALESVDFSSWQQIADEAGVEMDVAGQVRRLTGEGGGFSPQQLLDLLKELVFREARSLELIPLCAPALLWAVNRQLGSRLGEASSLVCYLAGCGAMLSLFSAQLQQLHTAAGRVSNLTGQVFPVLSSLMSAAGSAGTAGLLQPLFAFAGGGMTQAAGEIGRVLGGSAALLAVSGNLSSRISLKGLHKLCCMAGNWLLGSVMTVFLGLASVCGIMGRAQDGMSVRAAKYAVDNLLPVVGGDVADAMDAMVSGARLVRSAAGVTGAALLIAVCIRPVIRLALGMLAFRLAAAIVEPVADGPLKRCLEQMAQASQLLLVAAAVCMSVFLSLIGVVMGGGA